MNINNRSHTNEGYRFGPLSRQSFRENTVSAAEILEELGQPIEEIEQDWHEAIDRWCASQS